MFNRSALADIGHLLAAVDLQAVVLDAAGRVVFANRRAEALLNAPPNELAATPFDSLFSQRNPPWLFAQIRKLALAGGWSGEVILKLPDGSERWAHLQVCRNPASSSRNPGLLVLIEDVTEQAELTNTLWERSEELYNRNRELEVLNKIGRLMLSDSDTDTRLARVLNETAATVAADAGVLFLTDPQTGDLVVRGICGCAPCKLIGFRVRAEQDSFAKNVVRMGRTCTTPDITRERSDMNSVPARYNIKAAIGVPMAADGETMGVLMLGYARRRNEFPAQEVMLVEIIASQLASMIRLSLLADDVEQLHVHWQRTLDAMGDAVLVLDNEGRVVIANQPSFALVGLSRSEVIDKDCRQVLTELDGSIVQSILTSDHPLHYSPVCVGSDTCALTSVPLIGPHGKADAFVLCAHVITQETRLREEVDRAARLASIGEVFAGAAHSFGNIIMALQGSLETAKKAVEDGEPAEALAQRIERSLDCVGKGADVVRRLLSFSRATRSSQGQASLGAVARSVASLAKAHPSSAKRQITVTVPGDLPEVDASPNTLQEVLFNLVLNGLEATEPGGEVRIEADASESGVVRLKVIDNGCGIDSGVLDRVFEPFFSTKRGSGLGLPTSAAIVHQLGGSLSIDSAKGVGTTVVVRLPVAGAAGEERRAA